MLPTHDLPHIRGTVDLTESEVSSRLRNFSDESQRRDIYSFPEASSYEHDLGLVFGNSDWQQIHGFSFPHVSIPQQHLAQTDALSLPSQPSISWQTHPSHSDRNISTFCHHVPSPDTSNSYCLPNLPPNVFSSRHESSTESLQAQTYCIPPPLSPFPTDPFHASIPHKANGSSVVHPCVEQIELSGTALELPMASIAGPFIPQRMYTPHTTSDRRRYVEEVALQPPIYFWMHDPDECGISLVDALHSRVRRLKFRESHAFDGSSPSVSIRIEWPGYRSWSRQIPTKDFRNPPRPITRAKLVKNVAKCLERFFNFVATSQIREHIDQRWKIGNHQGGIKLEDLILVSIHHVSMGSWQPHLRLRLPRGTPRHAGWVLRSPQVV